MRRRTTTFAKFSFHAEVGISVLLYVFRLEYLSDVNEVFDLDEKEMRDLQLQQRQTPFLGLAMVAVCILVTGILECLFGGGGGGRGS